MHPACFTGQPVSALEQPVDLHSLHTCKAGLAQLGQPIQESRHLLAGATWPCHKQRLHTELQHITSWKSYRMTASNMICQSNSCSAKRTLLQPGKHESPSASAVTATQRNYTCMTTMTPLVSLVAVLRRTRVGAGRVIAVRRRGAAIEGWGWGTRQAAVCCSIWCLPFSVPGGNASPPLSTAFSATTPTTALEFPA